jgi:glycosyltransferase involved in cell wall biosynthesis
VIALVHGLRAWGAVERYVAAIAGALGERALLVYPDDPVLAPFARLGVRTVPFPAELLKSAPRLTRRLTGLLRGLRPDVVHVTEVFPPALVAARIAGVRRLFVTHHTPELPRRDNPAGRVWLKLGWAMRPTVIYTSEADRGRSRGRLPSCVIPLGIDLEKFTAQPVRESVLVGNVARLVEQKGHRTLLEAVPRVLERHPETRFVIAGEGELRAELERLSAPFGEHVVFLGEVSEIPELLATFAVFAFPSLYEGFSVAVVEAQAAGVPVVATPVGAIREAVLDGETGYLVPVRDAEALAERIVHVLDHPGEARRVAAEARRRAQAFSEDRMVAETIALYQADSR